MMRSASSIRVEVTLYKCRTTKENGAKTQKQIDESLVEQALAEDPDMMIQEVAEPLPIAEPKASELPD